MVIPRQQYAIFLARLSRYQGESPLHLARNIDISVPIGTMPLSYLYQPV
jgi:hypothetical protein